jgi:uncharacterized protein GlcG (DUF336 family)
VRPSLELSHDDALRIIEAIRRAIEETGGGGAAVAVADPHGELVAFLRTDGCRPSAITLAMNKAYTAAREHVETADLGPIMAAKGFPLTNFGDLRFLSFPGGVPIVVGGEVVGAVAVSGLPDQADIDLARLGARVITG